MKNLVLSALFLAFAAISCKNNSHPEFTRLGDGTPYGNSPEMMIGKVKTVIEKNYWGVPEGDSYKKGNALTKADRDSLGGWTDDFEAVYDENGILLSCTATDENGAQLWKNEDIIENGLIVKRNVYIKDTLSSYDVFKYDENKFLESGSRYRVKLDTLIVSAKVKNNSTGYPIEVQSFNYQGDSAWKSVYTYDAQNNFVSADQFDKTGKRVYKYEVNYNDRGKVSELAIKDKDDNITDVNYITYEYDQKGNFIKGIVKNKKGQVVIEERTYTYFN